jgi:hypothetical protein
LSTYIYFLYVVSAAQRTYGARGARERDSSGRAVFLVVGREAHYRQKTGLERIARRRETTKGSEAAARPNASN